MFPNLGLPHRINSANLPQHYLTMNKENYHLDEAEPVRRSKDLSRENLKFILSIVKAISLGAGTIVLFNLIAIKGIEGSVLSWTDFALKILLWIIACIALIVTYVRALLGTLFITHIPRQTETIWTFSLAAIEFLLYAILFPKFFLGEKEILKIWGIEMINFWFLFFGMYCLIAKILIRNGLSNIKKHNFHHADVSNIIHEYIGLMKFEINSSFGTGLLSLISFFIFPFINNLSYFYYIQLLIVLILLISICLAFRHQHKERLEIENLIKQF